MWFFVEFLVGLLNVMVGFLEFTSTLLLFACHTYKKKFIQ